MLFRSRPALFGTTKTFLDDLNLRSLEELPPLDELQSTVLMQSLAVAPSRDGAQSLLAVAPSQDGAQSLLAVAPSQDGAQSLDPGLRRDDITSES